MAWSRAMLRRLALLALWPFADLFLALFLGSKAWPIPVLLIYKGLSMMDLQVHQNILQIVCWHLHGDALAAVFPAPWWLRMALTLFVILLFFRCGEVTYWRIAVGAVGLSYPRSICERTQFISTWFVLGQRQIGPFDPALLFTLLMNLFAHRLKRAEPVLMLFATYACPP